MSSRLLCVALCLLAYVVPLSAGETGKIAGRVEDAQTGDPLIGISVVIEGTTMGASTDLDGRFTIVSVPPCEPTLTDVIVSVSPGSDVSLANTSSDVTPLSSLTVNRSSWGEGTVLPDPGS